jgi:hypothetical protein
MTITKDLQAISKELTKLANQTAKKNWQLNSGNFVSRQSMSAGEEILQQVKI